MAKELHELLKKERERQGLSKYKLSKMINTNPSHYGTMEAGKYSPSLDMLKRLCEALNVDITIHHNKTVTVKEKK